MRQLATLSAQRTRILPLLLAAPLLFACTSHLSIFNPGGSDGGVDGGTDGGTDGGAGDGGSGAVSIRIEELSADAGLVTLSVGNHLSLHVLARDSAGGESDVTAHSTLASSNTAVASIVGGQPPQLLGNAPGIAIVSASLPVTGGSPLTAQGSIRILSGIPLTTTAVQIAPATLTLAAGLRAQLSANATESDGSQLTVTSLADWSTNDSAHCTVDNSSVKGLVTAVAAGSCTITASYGGQSGTSAVTISALTATALSVSPSTAQVPKGATTQLAATATLSDGSAVDATNSAVWSSGATATATVANGLVTGVATGQTTITAALSSLSATAQLTVSAATLTTISVSPAQASVAAGEAAQFVATAVYSDSTTSDITAHATWTSSNASVAQQASNVNASGPASPGLIDALTPGQSTISATLGAVSGSALITVTNATAKQITISPSPITLPAGVSQQISANATFSDGTSRDVTSSVTWHLGNATYATISGAGLLTGTAAGSTTLTATLSGVSATANVTITQAQLVQILISPQNSAIAVGSTQQLSATGIYGDNSLQDVTSLATWTTSSSAIAGISNAAGSRGVATGAGAGTAQITAALAGITSGPASITVSAATLSSISINPRQMLTTVYITQPLQVIARYADGSQVDVTTQALYSSADATVASVVAAGAGAGQVTGVGSGRTTVTASFSGQSATTQVNVVPATLQSITVDIAGNRGGGPGGPGGPGGGTSNIEVGQSVQLRATAQFQGAPRGIDVTTLVTWSSSNTAVGQFIATPSGLFTALATGTSTATATLNGVSGTLDLTVTSATPVSIAVVQSAVSLPTGVTHALIAVATYADQSTQDVTYAATWTSDNNAAAIVSDTGTQKGLVTAVAAGTAHVTATLGNISGHSTVTVAALTATAISVTPVNPVVNAGGQGGGPGGPRGTQTPFYATAQFSDGSLQDVTQSAVWTSSDPSVATISDRTGTRGVASIVGTGSTTITATFRGLTGDSQLTSR